jgi:hypothetical protein
MMKYRQDKQYNISSILGLCRQQAVQYDIDWLLLPIYDSKILGLIKTTEKLIVCTLHQIKYTR